MQSGLVLLYDRGGEVVQQAYYKDRKRRRRIISDWIKQYGETGFNKCFLQIAPNTREDLVSIHSGMNLRKDDKTGKTIRIFKYKKSYEKWKEKYASGAVYMQAELKQQAI